MSSDPTAPPQGTVRFTTRLLLIAAALLVVLVGYFAIQHQIQWNAVRATESLGGQVHFNTGEPYRRNGPHGLFTRASALFGGSQPVWLFLSGAHVTDDAVEDCLLPLTSLELIGLHNVSISDGALTRLRSLPNLRELRCTRDSRNEAILGELEQPTRIDVRYLEVEHISDFLTDYHNVPMRVDRAALTAAGFDSYAPVVTYQTPPQITLQDALSAMLTAHDLGWHIHKGTIVITSKAAAQKKNEHREVLRRSLPNLRSLKID